MLLHNDYFRRWLNAWLIFLIALDQLLCVWMRLWSYVWLGTSTPNPDETISSFVGRNAIENKKWALITEKVINALFWFDPDHCRRHIEWSEIKRPGA